MLVIHDEQLAQRLEQIARKENRPVEDVLRTMVAQYPAETPLEAAKSERSAAFRRVRDKAYIKARKYWESVGDTEKASMTNEELDDQFGVFDEEGIPRLKSELETLEPPPGSLAYAAKIIKEMGGVRTGKSFDASKADDVLNEEFTDYLLKRMRGEDASE
jgi:hypothetical protein